MKDRSFILGAGLALLLCVAPPGCGKTDTDKLKDELKAERKKREESSEKYKEALNDLAEERRRSQSLESLLVKLGEGLEEEGKPVPETLTRAVKKKDDTRGKESDSSKSVEKLHQLGDNFYAKGNYDAARELYTAAMDLGVEDEYLQLRLGKCLIAAGEYDKAIPLYEKAIKKLEEKGSKEKLCQASNNLGWLYTQKGRYKEAENTYLKALKIDPNYANAYYNLGLLYDKHLKDEIGAIECFERYIALKGDRSAFVQKRLTEIRER